MASASKLIRTQAAIAAIRASVLASLVQELDRRHGKTDMLLAGHGVLRSQLSDPYSLIPMARYIAIFEDAAETLKEPTLGARMGVSFRPADIGPIGILFSTSSTIRTAFERLSKHITALQGATSSGLMAEDENVLWSYRIEDPRMWPRHQDAEYTLAASCQLVRTCFSAGWNPVEVHFEHAAPRDRAALQRIFRAPMLFNQSGNRIVISRKDIDRHYRNEDRDLTAVLERHILDLIGDAGDADDLGKRVSSVIGIYLGHKPITLSAVAAELSMAPRTLQRRLTERGTSLRDMIRDYRRNIAELHLDEGDSGHARIAEALGYADSTVFWRAFRSWTGSAPSRRNA